MYNLVYLIGRLVSDPKITETKNNEKICNMTLACQRTVKSIDGTFETDLIKCMAYDNVGTKTVEYCKKGDLIAIKGTIQTQNKTNKIIVEKISFLSSK